MERERQNINNFELPGKKVDTEVKITRLEKESLSEYKHSLLGEHPHDFIAFHNPLIEKEEDLREKTINEHNRFLILAENKETGDQKFFFLNFNILKTDSGDKISSTQDFDTFQSYIQDKSEGKTKNCFIQVNKNATTIHFPGESKALVAATMYEEDSEHEGFAKPVSLEKAEEEDIEQALKANRREDGKKILDRII